MKNLELNQMEGLQGGKTLQCYDEGNSFMVGAALAGLITGGPIGLMVGMTAGLVVGTYINMLNC